MASSKVVIVQSKRVLSPDGDINQNKLKRMYSRGIQTLTSQLSPKEALQVLFKNTDRVGIKINTLGGKKMTTRPEVSCSLANFLMENGIEQKNIIIWDRMNRELREAGYRLNFNNSGFKIFGTDTNGIGYTQELVSHLNIGSRFSQILSDMITASISLAVLKDHGMAGVTAGMKNYFGAIHNPNKYHDFNCNPFIAELFKTKYIEKKHKFSILDCLIVQYHRGPSFHSRWAEKHESLIFGLDPVATDFIGWQVIEKLRAKKGLPSLKEEKREPIYLQTAEKMGVGKANLKEIHVIEEKV